MTALELLAQIQPHLATMVKELPPGPARTAVRVAKRVAPAILGGVQDANEGLDANEGDATSQTHRWLESAATILLQQLPRVLPQSGVVGIATAAALPFLPAIIALVTVETVPVVYERSDLEHPPELV